MNEGIHLDLDTWIVPGQIRKANLCRGLGNTPAGVYLLFILVCYKLIMLFLYFPCAYCNNKLIIIKATHSLRRACPQPACSSGICILYTHTLLSSQINK